MQVVSRYDVCMSATQLQRPGGRSARVRTAVHDAVLDLVAKNPWDPLTVALVAERSGVHQATIYRRWETLAGLLNDVVAARWPEVRRSRTPGRCAGTSRRTPSRCPATSQVRSAR